MRIDPYNCLKKIICPTSPQRRRTPFNYRDKLQISNHFVLKYKVIDMKYKINM